MVCAVLVGIIGVLGVGYGTSPQAQGLLALQYAKAKWQAQGIRNYRLSVEVFAVPRPPYKLTTVVHNDQIVESTEQGRYTVSDLFDVLERHYHKGDCVFKATYDGRYGFPETIAVGSYDCKTMEHVNDGMLGLTVQDFAVLPRTP